MLAVRNLLQLQATADIKGISLDADQLLPIPLEADGARVFVQPRRLPFLSDGLEKGAAWVIFSNEGFLAVQNGRIVRSAVFCRAHRQRFEVDGVALCQGGIGVGVEIGVVQESELEVAPEEFGNVPCPQAKLERGGNSFRQHGQFWRCRDNGTLVQVNRIREAFSQTKLGNQISKLRKIHQQPRV